ncbi:MAG: hypothetical protein ACLGGX_00340 [Bdellovibrionia bacterium]
MITRVMIYGVLALLALSATTVAVVPSLRSQAKLWLQSDNRTLVAKAQGMLTFEGPGITVLKVKQADGLFIEIYKNQNSDESIQELMAKFKLPEDKDAHFTFQGNATNLALGDLDADGILEIMAPTFDDEMVARLHIYKYNAESQTFDRMNSLNK